MVFDAGALLERTALMLDYTTGTENASKVGCYQEPNSLCVKMTGFWSRR